LRGTSSQAAAKDGLNVGDLVNLNKFRKRRQSAAAAKQASENRVRFGRDKTERGRTRAEQDRQSRNLDGKQFDDTRPEDSD
jgi:Domain of unknown function (DUF4169)